MAAKFKVGIIGLGAMGRCIVSGLLDSKEMAASEIGFTTRQAGTAKPLADELGITACKDNLDLVARCETIVLAIKPQNLSEVLAEIAPKLKPGQTLVSIVASFSTGVVESQLAGPVAVLRAMPNTPTLVREGITAICAGKYVKEEDWSRACRIFESVGKVVRIEEKHMDGVTGLSGSGPAFVYVVLESLTEAGVKVGLPRDLAIQLASQTVLGAAKMLQETGRHPASLKDDVTTPAGCTIEGLMALEEGKLRVTLIKAVAKSAARASSLSCS